MLALAAQVASGTSLPQLEADRQDFDTDTGRMVASGNVELSHGDIFLQSERLITNQEVAEVSAEGNVRLTVGRYRITTEQASYNYQTEVFKATNFRLGAYPVYIEGGSLHGSIEGVTIEDATIYFYEPSGYSVAMQTPRLQVDPEQRMRVEDVLFKVGEVPFFYVPSYSQDVDQELPLFYDADAGQRSDLGFYWQNQLLVRPTPNLKIGVNLDGYSERGILAGPAAELRSHDPQGWQLDSRLNTGFLHDYGSTSRLGRDLAARPIDPFRYFVQFEQAGGYAERWDFNAQVRAWSDTEALRDYREAAFEQEQFPATSAALAYRQTNWLSSLSVQAQPTDGFSTTEQLPRLEWRGLPAPLWETGLYHEQQLHFAHLLAEDEFGRFADLEADRIHGYYGLSYPLDATSWLQLRPLAGVALTHYAHIAGQSEDTTRLAGELGFDASMLATGTWDVSADLWGINGLRHSLRPVLSYRYLPGAGDLRRDIPRIERRPDFTTRVQPLGLAQARALDDLETTNTLRLGVENLLQTRQSGYGSRDLVGLDVYQDIHLERAPARAGVLGEPGRPAQDTLGNQHTTLSLFPAYWLDMHLYTRTDLSQGDLNQVSSRLTLRDADLWALSFGNDYLRDVPLPDDLQQYVVGAQYRINERNVLNAEWRVDAALGELTQQYYAWETRLANAWALQTRLGILNGSDRESSLSISMRVRLLSF